MVPDLTCCCAPQPYYLCGEGAAVFHWSVKTTGAQLYSLPSLRRRPRAGKFICGPAINTSSRASLVSNCCRFGGLLDQTRDRLRLRHIDRVTAFDLDDCRAG